MANVKLFSTTGSEKGMVDLAPAVFDVAPKIAVVHQVYLAHLANARESWADTKDRSQVSGGGKKPWQQKGTGRARHGSIRSPIWKGGGVAFGPLSSRNYKTKTNKKTRRLATKMCLSDKANQGALWIVEKLAFTEPKTKLFAKLLKVLPAKQHSFLVLTSGKDETILRITKNVPKIQTMRAEDVSVADLLNKQAVITSLDGIKKIEQTLA